MIRLKRLLQEWTGESWTACRQWKSHREKYVAGTDRVSIEINKGLAFRITYTGPATGISLSHAEGGSGDTLHQLFNILICEINPWLANKQMKPHLRQIITQCLQLDKTTYKFTIVVPCLPDSEAWQLNHRGGWGHDPGMSAVVAASPKKAIASGQLETITEYTKVPGHRDITTNFSAYPLSAL